MLYLPVKFGGDSGAVQQVSDIGHGFERSSFTAASRVCHRNHVKREIITALCLRSSGTGGGGAVALAVELGAVCAPRALSSLNAEFSAHSGGLPCESTKRCVSIRPFRTAYRASVLGDHSFQNQIDLQDLVEGDRRMPDAAGG